MRVCVCVCVVGRTPRAGLTPRLICMLLHGPAGPVCVCVGGEGGECHGNTVPFKHGSLCCRRKAALGNLIKELAADKLCELKAFY